MRTGLVFGVLTAVMGIAHSSRATDLKLEKGDRICLIGNALGERLQHHNHWETLLYQQLPELDLAVRNLCFPADEPEMRLRSMNFGSPDDHLKHSRASVILFFFGLNESFRGESGRAPFVAQMTKLVEETLQKNYNGKGAPKIVLVSPIAFEDTGDPNFPSGAKENKQIEAYSKALKLVADKTGVAYIDLFNPSKKLFAESDKRLTLNGVHLNEAGVEATIEEAAADKGYHAAEQLELADSVGLRTYIPERERKYLSRWTDKPPEQKFHLFAHSVLPLFLQHLVIRSAIKVSINNQ